MSNSLEQSTIRDWHTALLLPVLAGSLLLGLVWIPDVSTQVAIMAIGVATIGLGHGSMDHHVGEILMRRRFGRSSWIIFGVTYLTLGAVAFAGWMVAPTVALIVFLVYSAFHFGSDRYQTNGIINTAARGVIPILLPIAFHPEEVSKLFSVIASTNFDVEKYRFAAGILSASAILVTILASARQKKYFGVAETILLVGLNFTCPPLISFTLYFVFLHSVRHIIELAGWLEPRSITRGFRRIALQSLLLTSLLLVAGTIMFSLVPADDIQPSIIQLVFVGLSCLTVPHMAVTHLAEKQLIQR